MLFCSKCDNMYYIKLDKDNDNQLINYCKKCGHVNNEVNSIIENNNNYNIDIINEYTKYDPTLPRLNNMPCPNTDCISHSDKTQNEIIYIKYNESDMKFLYLCAKCDTSWKI